jgi:outer membrane receptor protein involved in Fe transport
MSIMKKFELLAASAIALLSATPALAHAAAQAQTTTDTAAPAQAEPAAAAPEGATHDQVGGIGDIIVTAQRQSQRLQDVPIAVSAFTAQNLAQQQIVNPAALEQSLPNVSFTKTNFTSSSFTIRGIGDLCTGTSCDSATGIAINDMPLVSTRLFETEFYDLERIEVLRGPQGTLFGRNATSGVINFITAKPDLSGMHADGEFEYGNFDSKKAKAMFNLPVGDTIGLRVAGLWLNRDGFTKNIYNDTRIDGRKLYSVRGTLSWEPDSDTRLDLIGYYFHEKDDRSRIQKQLCHRDPTGILGCGEDRLIDAQPQEFVGTEQCSQRGIPVGRVVAQPVGQAPQHTSWVAMAELLLKPAAIVALMEIITYQIEPGIAVRLP